MCQTLTFSQAVRRGAALLAEAGIDDPRREARLLAAHLLGLPPGGYPDPERVLDAEAWQNLVARRAGREPMAFITGRRGFWTLDLAVSPDTLIPRPDSEALIEAARQLFPASQAVSRILDLGTGTGCLLLAALTAFPAAFGVGVDLAPAASALAAANAASHALDGRAVFLAGDWAAALAAKFDLILSNPPYIPSADIAGLMPEVARHEPASALDGGPDGLAAYRSLVRVLPGLLAPGGVAILELGIGQAAAVRALADQAGLHHLGLAADLAGIARAIKLCRRADADFWAKKLFGSTAVGS